MASAFGHVAVAWALGKTLDPKLYSLRFWGWAFFCSVLPDLDVVGFAFGIPYEHLFGHRGFTHSILFAIVVGLMVPRLAVKPDSFPSISYGRLAFFFFGVTLSHGLLDACTNGGLGIAFFAPFDSTRYFSPWTPLKVSPIGIGSFFSYWGIQVILSEVVWIGIPVGLWFGFLHVRKKTMGGANQKDFNQGEG